MESGQCPMKKISIRRVISKSRARETTRAERSGRQPGRRSCFGPGDVELDRHCSPVAAVTIPRLEIGSWGIGWHVCGFKLLPPWTVPPEYQITDPVTPTIAYPPRPLKEQTIPEGWGPPQPLSPPRTSPLPPPAKITTSAGLRRIP